jgi:AmiR/NasT family two-component response regulator
MLRLAGSDQPRVLVIHPDNGEGETLATLLRRIGCRAEVLWPPPERLPHGFDVAYCLVDQHSRRFYSWVAQHAAMGIVAVVEHGASDVQALLDECHPHAVVSKPADPFSKLTSFLVARSISRYERRLTTKVRKLEETLKSVKKVEQAKAILMKTKNIPEKDAYEFLRKWAMERRIPIGQVASAIVEADGMLT